jgi:hypothetical protein
MTNIFLSYRRDDAGGHAGRLSDRLAARFGAERVFMDVQDIQPGQNFEHAIEQTLARCDHMLAVVGPRWLQILDARQASGEDFVRHELAVALARGTTVIPVLVGGAKMPAHDQLPADLAAFGRCQAVDVRDDRFDEDAARLVTFLADGVNAADVTMFGRRAPRRTLVGALAVLVVALVGGWLMWPTGAPERAGAPDAASTPEPAPEPTIDGEWIAEVQKAGQPPFRIRLTLVRSGAQIIGSVRYPTGEGTILDGKYADGRITFHTSHVPQFASEPATIRIQASVEGDLLRLTTADDGGIATGVARRAPAAPGRGVATSLAPPARALPSLSYGTWTLRNARDEEGKNWSNSVLQITSQEEAPDGLILRGQFTWRLDSVLMGTEAISGRYVERTRQVILEGSAVTDAPHGGRERLAVGSYSAIVAADERSLLKGRWGSTAQNEPGFAGEWEAVR